MDDGYFHGINKMKKPGFKVIKPPGGQTQINIFAQDHEVKSSPINACQAERNSSSIMFGRNDSSVKNKSSADRNCSSIVFGGPELPTTPSIDTTPKKSDLPKAENGVKHSNGTSNNTANGTNGVAKDQTPVTNSEQKQSPPNSNDSEMRTPQNDNSANNVSNVRSSTKVMAPPGGRSSINLFGP